MASSPGGKRAERIRVAVRVRPLGRSDKNRVISCSEDSKSILIKSGSLNLEEEKRFNFDFCAQETLSQEDIFQKCGILKLLDAGILGMNVTVMAYGATGSGKTYTMLGNSQSEAGLTERSAQYLFEKNKNEHKISALFVSFYEVYEERVYDLLASIEAQEGIHKKNKALPLRHDVQSKRFFVAGLIELECYSAEDVSTIIDQGRRARRQAAHKLNRDSSRGHAVLSIKIYKSNHTNFVAAAAAAGKINFVDLAGSERLTKSELSKATETGSINRSLFALGKVIAALTSDNHEKYIPYRDSTLTKLLMDSLGGSVFTLMLACISPDSHQLNESLGTLYYAHRAKGIVNSPSITLATKVPSPFSPYTTKIHRDQREILIATLQAQVARLSEENSKLKARLSQQKDEAEPRPSSSFSSRSNNTRSHSNLHLCHNAKQTEISPTHPCDSAPGHDQHYSELDSKILKLEQNFSSLQAKLEQNDKPQKQAYLSLPPLNSRYTHLSHSNTNDHSQFRPPSSFPHHHNSPSQRKPHYETLPSPLQNAQPRDEYYTSGERRRRPSAGFEDSASVHVNGDSIPAICAVHRQHTGDIVRRHREGIF